LSWQLVWGTNKKKKFNLLCVSNFLMMVSMMVVLGATCPLRTGMAMPCNTTTYSLTHSLHSTSSRRRRGEQLTADATSARGAPSGGNSHDDVMPLRTAHLYAAGRWLRSLFWASLIQWQSIFHSTMIVHPHLRPRSGRVPSEVSTHFFLNWSFSPMSDTCVPYLIHVDFETHKAPWILSVPPGLTLKTLRSTHTVYWCVLHLFCDKQRQFLCTARDDLCI
jgi:hypothetical protein